MRNNRRYPRGQTDEDWQREFESLRSSATKAKCESPLLAFSYDPIYANFLNGVLETIRAGETDYCFFVYQVEDLLYFENERLEVRWLPEDNCFRVRLSESLTGQ